MRAERPVAQIDAALQADIDEIVGTPRMLVSDQARSLVAWLQRL